jgi:hypothetical protein
LLKEILLMGNGRSLKETLKPGTEAGSASEAAASDEGTYWDATYTTRETPK